SFEGRLLPDGAAEDHLPAAGGRPQRRHGRVYSHVTPRLLAALAVAGLLVAGCGSGSHRKTQAAQSPETVVRSWSRALNSGDNERAARLFAVHAEIVQGGLDVRL